MSVSPYTVGHAYIEYADGTTNFWLPKTWHNDIRTVVEAANRPEAVTGSATSEGDGSSGFISYMATEVGIEVGTELIGTLFQAGKSIIISLSIQYISNALCLSLQLAGVSRYSSLSACM